MKPARETTTSITVSLLLCGAFLFIGWLDRPPVRARASWPAEGIYSGYFMRGFELSTFVPSGSNERWHFTGRAAEHLRLFEGYPVYVEVRATLSAQGGYGHLSQYRRELNAGEVLTVRRMLPPESAEALP